MQKMPNKNVKVLDRKREQHSYVKQPSSDKKKVFIVTTDEITKDCLIEAGFKFLAKSGDRYFFPFDEAKAEKCMNFADWDEIGYTDVLTF